MRDIKFRVWDKDYTTMHVCGTNIHDSISFISDLACYYNLQNGCGSLPDGTGTYDLMQYTGIKDKEGTEIYEGDLVESTDCIDEVIFKDGCFMLKPVGCTYHTVYLHEMAKYIKVIGNKYQHPNLLEVEK